MLGLAGSWACRGLLRQQQRGQAKQQMLLLLAFLVDCCIGVSASAHLRCSISNNTGARFASFVGGTWSCPSFRRAFLAPASSSKSADKPNSLWTSLKPQHVNCRRMHNEVASRNTRPEGLVRAYPTRWVMEPGAHREGGPTFSKQSMLLRSFPVDTTIYGGPLTLLMRAHVHRSHSRLGRPASHRKSLLRNLATQLIRHGSIITTAAKGKELRRVIDSKIVLAKKGGLHNYRQALGFFYDKKLTRSLFQQIKYTSTTTPPFFIIYPKYLSVCCVRYEGPNKVRTKKQRIL